jgi:hypothetical protein
MRGNYSQSEIACIDLDTDELDMVAGGIGRAVPDLTREGDLSMMDGRQASKVSKALCSSAVGKGRH